jgi:hypothetical protein
MSPELVDEAVRQMEYDRQFSSGVGEAAKKFRVAWWFHDGTSRESMVWALGNEALPYREYLIAHLVAWELSRS